MIVPLLNRNFILLWQGQFVSQVGNQAYLIALMFWLLENTGSAGLMGLVLMASSIPAVVFGPLAGAFVDRHPKKVLIVVSDVVRGCSLMVLTITIAASESTQLIVATLVIVASVNGMAASVFNPAVGATIPDLVPSDRVREANSLNQMTAHVASFLGLAAGGALYSLLGPTVLFAADAISFLLSGLSESFIQFPKKPAPTQGQGLSGYVEDLLEGWRFVVGQKGMLIFVVEVATINLLFMPIYILLPFFTTDVLGKGSAWYGVILAGMSIGSILGLIVVARFKYTEHPSFVALNLVGVGASMILLGVAKNAYVGTAIMFGLGFLTAQINVLVFTFLQLRTPEVLRGRVLAFTMALAGLATPLGLGLGGAFIELTGVHVTQTYLLLGSIAFAVTVVGAISRPFRTFLLPTKIP